MNNIKLSIIIPYYKTYEMTRSLLNSLISQKTDEVEIILVDDGCYEERFKAYTDIILINQNNKGVSSSRNKGLDIAKGKYIAFIDSDDLIMINYVETLLDLIDKRDEDIIYFNWMDINTNEIITYPKNPAVWKAIYKKEILPRFNEALSIGEDFYLLQELSKRNPTEFYYNKVLYIYNSGREDSLTQRNKRGEL